MERWKVTAEKQMKCQRFLHREKPNCVILLLCKGYPQRITSYQEIIMSLIFTGLTRAHYGLRIFERGYLIRTMNTLLSKKRLYRPAVKFIVWYYSLTCHENPRGVDTLGHCGTSKPAYCCDCAIEVSFFALCRSNLSSLEQLPC